MYRYQFELPSATASNEAIELKNDQPRKEGALLVATIVVAVIGVRHQSVAYLRYCDNRFEGIFPDPSLIRLHASLGQPVAKSHDRPFGNSEKWDSRHLFSVSDFKKYVACRYEVLDLGFQMLKFYIFIDQLRERRKTICKETV